jgi:hypothetical protein
MKNCRTIVTAAIAGVRIIGCFLLINSTITTTTATIDIDTALDVDVDIAISIDVGTGIRIIDVIVDNARVVRDVLTVNTE